MTVQDGWQVAGALAKEAPSKSACNWKQWEVGIAAFEKQDAERPFAPGGVVFVGSSSIRLWDLGKCFPDQPVLNRGFGGSQLCDSVHFLDQLVVKHKPRLVVLYAGDNDIAAGKSAKAVHADFLDFQAGVAKALPDARIAFLAVKPSPLRWKFRDVQREANRLIAEECSRDKRATFVDVWPPMIDDAGQPRKELFRDDGLHMNDAGYKVWNDLVRPLLATPVR
jgi:lysophospholipase L1-like esterase